MKQRFTYLLALMLMCIVGASTAMAEKALICASTMVGQPSGTAGSTTNNNIWYGNGTALEAGFTVQITGNMGKGLSSQNPSNGSFSQGTSFKNSNGAQNTITLPTGYTATSVTFYVTTNKDADAVLQEFNGTKCEDAVTSRKDGSNPTVISKTLAEPANSFTFTFGTSQVFFIAEVTYAVPSSDPPVISTDLPATKNVTTDKIFTLSIDAKGATSYQWYGCQDANKTGAYVMLGATSNSVNISISGAFTAYYYCVATNENGSTSSNVIAVTAKPWEPITTARAWNFTQQSKWADAQAAASTIWGTADSSKRYQNQKALNKEELCGNDGPLDGLAGVYFTCDSKKLYLGGKDDKSKCVQLSGTVTVTVPDCNKGDRISIRYCGAGSTECTITSSQIVEGVAKTTTDRTNTDVVVVSTPGDVNLAMSCSKGLRLYEIKVTPYFAVTDFELSTDKVSVEEFENVSVSAKNFTPSNYTDGTMEWTTSDAAVATVNNGVITGVKAGTATITATSVDGPSKSLEVTVTATAPKNLSVEMTSNSDAAAPKVESGKTFKLTSNAQGYGFTYQWASKTSANGAWTDIADATDASYEETAVELGSKFFKVTITNAEGSASQEYEVKTVVPLEAFTVDSVNYKALDADEPQVKVRYQLVRADEETAVNLPDSVVYKGLTYAVKMIGEEAYVNNMTVVSLTNPATIEEIGARAFMFCINLTEINLNEGLKKIGDAAFFGCNGLTTVSLPGSIEYLGFKSFSECANLTDIYYDGTKEEWYELPNIEKVGIAKSVTIHFNDGTEENGKGNVVGIDNASAAKVQKDGKYFENGNIVIVKGGKKFNAAGAEMK